MNKFYLLILILFLSVIDVSAQNIVPKRLRMLNTDILAQTQPRLDNEGNKCAVIRVDIVGVKNMEFVEAIGDVKYANNEYIVYVPDGTQTLTYSIADIRNTINLEEYGPEISGGSTYRFIFETENKLRSAIFYVKPNTAKITIANKTVSLDETGTGSIDLPIGEYNYQIIAGGYLEESGLIELKEEELFTAKDIALEPITYNVAINTNQPSAMLFVDGKPIGSIESIQSEIRLAEGKHTIRITKEGFNDYEEDIITNKNISIDVQLNELKTKFVYHKNERTKSSISLRKHIDFLLGGKTYIDDSFKSYNASLGVDFHQYIGYLSFKEGLGVGATQASENFIDRFDKYDNDVDAETLPDSLHRRIALSLDIPLQVGFTVPLSLYNTSQVSFYAGLYGSMYYIGHHSKHMKTNESNSTYTFDYGARANVNFYIHKFIVSFEGNYSLSKNKIGPYVGVALGYRLYVKK